MSLVTVGPPGATPRAAEALPPLGQGDLRLREVEIDDAVELAALFSDPLVAAHLSLAPSSAEAFGDWAQLSRVRRAEGRSACYVVEVTTAVSGLFIASRATADANSAEAGFVLAPRLWGTGHFSTASTLFLSFLFDHWPIQEVRVRTRVSSHRGSGAMRKLGAVIIDDTGRGDDGEYVWSLDREAWRGRQTQSA